LARCSCNTRLWSQRQSFRWKLFAVLNLTARFCYDTFISASLPQRGWPWCRIKTRRGPEWEKPRDFVHFAERGA
jgi:hypothetical protein